jgi:hypothetical protein
MYSYISIAKNVHIGTRYSFLGKKEPAADLPVQSKQETSTANGHVPGIYH